MSVHKTLSRSVQIEYYYILRYQIIRYRKTVYQLELEQDVYGNHYLRIIENLKPKKFIIKSRKVW